MSYEADNDGCSESNGTRVESPSKGPWNVCGDDNGG
jgi:hypothetical protein